MCLAAAVSTSVASLRSRCLVRFGAGPRRLSAGSLAEACSTAASQCWKSLRALQSACLRVARRACCCLASCVLQLRVKLLTLRGLRALCPGDGRATAGCLQYDVVTSPWACPDSQQVCYAVSTELIVTAAFGLAELYSLACELFVMLFGLRRVGVCCKFADVPQGDETLPCTVRCSHSFRAK